MTIWNQPKDGVTVVLTPGVYKKVTETYFNAGAEQHAMVYLCLRGFIKPGFETGKIRVCAARRGVVDPKTGKVDRTSYHDYVVTADTISSSKPGPFEHLITLPWFGARPAKGWFDYEVKPLTRIVSATANNTDADYGKSMTN